MGAAGPSLFLSPEEREEFLARIGSPRGRPIWERLWSQARESVEKPLPADVREGAWAADARQVDRLGRLIELWSLAHFVTGEERFAERGTEALLALAALEQWVSDSHSHVRYDLMTGSISQELALGYDFLRDHLTEGEREAEERTVHALTYQLLSTLRLDGLPEVLSAFKDWRRMETFIF
jgi:hypothetical protein